MSATRSWSLPEQHLMPDAVVAFVDGELSPVARDRAAHHIAKCPFCATETRTQRQARSAVRSADDPGTPASLLAALRAIPVDTDLPGGPDNLAVGPDGQLFAIQRPERVPGLNSSAMASSPVGSSAMMGSSQPLGSGNSVLHRGGNSRRVVQGAGLALGGLVLGALVVVGPHMLGGGTENPTEPPVNRAGFNNAPMGAGVLPANANPAGEARQINNGVPATWTSVPATSTSATSARARVIPAVAHQHSDR